jgi:rod shape-determining protein MreD
MGYFSTWTERAEASARLIAPYSLMAVLFIFNTVSFSFPLTGSITAPLLLMAIYYWAIYRPTLIPAWIAFAAGLLVDLISGIDTVGISALVFVIVRWVMTDQRRYFMGQSFLMIWIGFTIVEITALFVEWAVYGILGSGWLPLRPLYFSALMGVAVFPIVSMLLHMTHRILPQTQGHFISAKAKKL